MPTAMVSARMSATKKEAGARVLEKLGSNASSVINQLYDYIIDHNALPWDTQASGARVSGEQLAESLSWVDSLQVDLPSEFAQMTTKEARLRRLATRNELDGGVAR